MYFYLCRFNAEKNYDFNGPIPDISNFILFSDKKQEVEDKKIFVDNFGKNNWNFKEQICSVLASDLLIFATSCLTFIKNTFDFQARLKQHLNIQNNLIIHPFGDNTTSIASFSQKQFSYYYLNEFEMFAVKNEYSGIIGNVSSGEYEFVCFKTFANPEKKYVHSFNSPTGPKKFKKFSVDLYSEVAKEVVEYHGCYTHGHYGESCGFPNRKALTRSSLNFQKIPLGNIEVRDRRKKEYLLQNFPDQIKSFKVVWECMWQQVKKDHLLVTPSSWCPFFTYWEYFLNNCQSYQKGRPMRSLTPRYYIININILCLQFRIKKAGHFIKEKKFSKKCASFFERKLMTLIFIMLTIVLQ